VFSSSRRGLQHSQTPFTPPSAAPWLTLPKDLISGDEIVSDVYAVKDAGNGLFEVDGKMVKPGSENFGTIESPIALLRES
jgi:hypothetical protein